MLNPSLNHFSKLGSYLGEVQVTKRGSALALELNCK